MLSLVWLVHTTLLLGQGHLQTTYGITAQNCQNELFRAARIQQNSEDTFDDGVTSTKRIKKACYNNGRQVDGTVDGDLSE